jgi:hypothetical protein
MHLCIYKHMYTFFLCKYELGCVRDDKNDRASEEPSNLSAIKIEVEREEDEIEIGI